MADTLGLLCWACGDTIKDKIRSEISAAADDEHALTDEERTDKLADLGQKRLLAERHYEHFLDEMERGGMSPFRARGSSPEAVLGVEVVKMGGK